MSDVKRYELHFAADSMLKVDDAGRFVLASDYDTLRAEVVAYQMALTDERGRNATAEMALRAEVELLRHALERINARAEAYTEDGGGMTECSTLVVAEIARTALETTK